MNSFDMTETVALQLANQSGSLQPYLWTSMESPHNDGEKLAISVDVCTTNTKSRNKSMSQVQKLWLADRVLLKVCPS